MSVSASSQAVREKRTLSTLLAGRVVKRLKQEDGERLREATIQLLEQQQNICSLLREVEDSYLHSASRTQDGEQQQAKSAGISSAVAGSLLVCELRRQASQLGVPVAVLAVKTLLERMLEITGAEEVEEEERKRGGLLTSSQRVQLCVLLESSKHLLSQGALCPKLLWQEYRRDQRQPALEVLYHLHSSDILTLKYVLESDEGARLWLVSQLKSLCSWTPPPGEDQTRLVQNKVLSTVVGVLVGAGFQTSHEPETGPKRISRLCCSVLDDMLSWLLDTVDKGVKLPTDGAGVESWTQMFDASLCGVTVSAEALRSFFTHSLTQTLTYKPRLAVSDAITLQNEWTFAKASPLVTSLFRKLAVIFSVEQLLRHLRQILETHEVNWKHVLCFVSTLLVYNPCAQPSLREMLSRLLSSAFEGYDLENMITAFLLARQGALQGPGIFPSYSDWFKMSFGGSSSYHASSKKSVVFLLKFLSDLVPFEPTQYLKIHILHPPFVPVKHRSLLMEYVSLAKTRLADLKESVEDMGLYEDVSGAGGVTVQPQCQAVQDVEKALSLFKNTGRIPAAVTEASIFRRLYFQTRFLPTLLTPRVLPVKADTRMAFIEMLKKTDKIPAALFSSYVEACKNHRQQDGSEASAVTGDDPLEVLRVQLQDLTELNVEGNDGEMSAQLSRISHSLSVLFPDRPDQLVERPVIKLHVNAPPSSELHVKVVNMILRNFCQCMLDTSQANPPNRQSLWASRFVSALLGNTQLLSSLIHRLWDLFHNQGPLLSAAHLLGLAVLMVHLHVSMSPGPLVQLVPPTLPQPAPVEAALGSGLLCSTHTHMQFCVRLCMAAVCYGMCRGDLLPQQQDYILPSFYKTLQYLIPRLLPEARRAQDSAGGGEVESVHSLWSSITDSGNTWRKTALLLWRHPAFSQLQQQPQYQLSLSEWLISELRVQRSEDALTDPERQEYQQWACLEHFLCCPEDRGGCGGDLKNLCSCLLKAIMDQHSSSEEKLDPRVSETGTCVPDFLSRLQELVYEMEVSGADTHDFLFELASERFSSAMTSASGASISTTLSLQHTLSTWNRVLLALPPVLFIKVRTEGGRSTLDCSRLIEHVNQHQRTGCSSAGLLPCHVTSHFLRGVLCAGARCGRSAEEVNKAWSQISQSCPLLLVSTVHWWERLCPVLLCLWRRLCDGEPLPGQLQLLSDCSSWACSLEKGPSPAPAAGPLLLAASLHRACSGSSFTAALKLLQPQRDSQHRQLLVFLLSLCVKDYLSALLDPQEKNRQETSALCSQLLPVLVDSADWLLIFQSNGQGVYQATTMVLSDEFSRLLPWAFYSLLLMQSTELRQRAWKCPGFLHTAVPCYISLMQHFLEGSTFAASDDQVEPDQVLRRAKCFLLCAISRAPPTFLSSSRLRQLQAQCADLDPEVEAALSAQLDHPSLSPEMDFL